MDSDLLKGVLTKILTDLLEQESRKQDKKLHELFEEKLQPLHDKLGATFELGARSEIALRLGTKYAVRFMIEDLYGLTRMVFPKEIQTFEINDQGGSSHPWSDTLGIHDKRTDVLCGWMYSSKN